MLNFVTIDRRGLASPVRAAGPSTGHRPDIDGLRALAILPVVFYHLGVAGFSGGFVGVDVFFVISGYLMASVISREIGEGRFSLVSFYERRARRIFPALAVVLAASCIAAWFLLMPLELEYFGRSLRSAVTFTANARFERESGYFDIGAGLKPLLNLWSLSVEEQFYLVFPLLLIALFRLARGRVTPMTGVLAAVSFCAGAWAVFHNAGAAFYLIQYRAWELLAGGLLALSRFHPPKSSVSRDALAAAGVLLIAAAVFRFDDALPFPGPLALVPCLGALLVLHARAGLGRVGSLLSSQALVGVGLVSYSLYLWHWPLIVFSREYLGRDLAPAEKASVLAVSLVLAYLSWRFVERPFRGRDSAFGRKSVVALSLAAGAALFLFGTAVVRYDGVPSRLAPDVARVYAATYDTSRFGYPPCLVDADGDGPTTDAVRAGKLCGIGPTDGVPSFVVWGDSHSAAMLPAIEVAAERAGLSGLQASHASCPPLPGVVLSSAEKTASCGAFNAAVLDMIRAHPVATVFLVAYWPKYALDSELPDQGPFFDPSVPPPTLDRSASVRDRLDALMTELGRLGTKVVLVMDVPEMGRFMPEAVAKAMMAGASTDLAPPFGYVTARQAVSRALLAAAAEKYGATVVDPLPVFCPESRCVSLRDGLPLYKDSDHITATASRALAPLFDPVFAHPGAPAPVHPVNPASPTPKEIP